MRTTNLTTAITDLLNTKHLLSANDILEHFKKAGHIYNKTSVYRALDQLLAEDKICKHSFSNNEAAFESRDHHHDHLICENCGKVEGTNCSFEAPKVIKGFRVDHHHLSMFGVCAKCLNK